MKITFLVPYKGLSGGLKVISTYGNAFLRRGHDVNIIYPEQKRSWKENVKYIYKKEVQGYKDHLDLFKGNLKSVTSWNSESLEKSDCYIATGWSTAEILSRINRESERHFYFVQHLETWDGEEERVLKTYRLPMKMITISNWLKEELESLSGNRKIPVIWNGKDYMLSEYKAEGLAREFDIGIIGSNVGFKRTDIGMESIRMVQKKFPNLKIAIIAPHRLNEETPVNSKVFISPSSEEIRNIYLNTKIWISSSDKEGFCLPALESISLGCALVATDSLGIRDIIESRKNGILVEPGKPELLAKEILHLMENPEEIRKYSIEGLGSSEKFSWDRSVSEFLNVLESKS